MSNLFGKGKKKVSRQLTELIAESVNWLIKKKQNSGNCLNRQLEHKSRARVRIQLFSHDFNILYIMFYTFKNISFM